MTTAQKKLIVIDPDNTVQKEVINPDHYLFRIEVQAKEKERDSFLVLKSSTLNQIADRAINQSRNMQNLRIVFVRIDSDTDRFFDKVQELNAPELLQKIFRVTAVEQINRILKAWHERQADIKIANAYVEQDDLIVQACDLKRYRIKFADFAGLAELPKGQRKQFQIGANGNQIFWPGTNTTIDLDVVRYKVDEQFRKAKNSDALSDYKDYLGQAIKAVMSTHHLTQAALRESGGPAERHLYRIERGEQELTSAMIDRLATAHGLSSQDYIDELVMACDQIVEEEAASLCKH